MFLLLFFRWNGFPVSVLLIIMVASNVMCGNSSDESFDFVVVGGGIAGCTVASRLSENGAFSVLLLEAGGYPNPGLDIPGVVPLYMENGRYTKEYESAGGFTYLTGWTLGGGSSINGFVFNRGSPYDWDNWGNLTGDVGWKYGNMLKYFKRVERYMGDFPSDQHGYSGHITVSRPSFAPGMETILSAGRSLGYSVADPNGPQQVSFTPIEFTKRRGRRVSAFTGYLKPYLGKRKNLKVVTGGKVERIVFENRRGQGITAVGVLYSQDGGIVNFARARKEVILSAGVVESPVILMKSGIGPQDNLEKVGIPIVKELPVGVNLHDHVILRLQFMINDTSQVFLPERDLTLKSFKIYNSTGQGPYSTHDADNTQAFLASSLTKNSSFPNWADLQLQFVSSGLSAPIPADILPGETGVSCVLILVRPKSRGTLSLNASSGEPNLNFQYLQDPRDEETLLDGIEKVLQIYEGTPAFQRIGARYSSLPMQECSSISFRSREYWQCFVRHTFHSGFHGAGSCRMGNSNDNNAVVDSTLSVIGIQNLRVVDASIMPQVTNAHIQAGVYAIAEKAAELILERWMIKSARGGVRSHFG